MIRKLDHDTRFCFSHSTSLALRHSARLWLSLLIGIAVLSATARVRGQATFNGLGLFGGQASTATDVSADASVVVGTVRTERGLDLFRWSADETIVRGEGGGSQPAVSADGTVVVGTHFFPPRQAIRWPVGGTFQGLGGLPGEPVGSVAFDVSADGGVVVGEATTSSAGVAFRWTQETGMVSIGDLPGGRTESLAFGVSGDGRVVVGYGYETESFRQASRWTAETGMLGLGVLPGAQQSIARAVSADGSVAVGVNFFPPVQPHRPDAESEAFRWTQTDGMVGLGDLRGGPVLSDAFDVSGDGSIIVGSGRDAFGRRAMLWTPESGMLDLRDVLVSLGATNLDGWTLVEANGISLDGLTIVGVGDHNGRTEAFVATIPEPSTLVLAVLAAAGLLAFYTHRARRHRGSSMTD